MFGKAVVYQHCIAYVAQYADNIGFDARGVLLERFYLSIYFYQFQEDANHNSWPSGFCRSLWLYRLGKNVCHYYYDDIAYAVGLLLSWEIYGCRSFGRGCERITRSVKHSEQRTMKGDR